MKYLLKTKFMLFDALTRIIEKDGDDGLIQNINVHSLSGNNIKRHNHLTDYIRLRYGIPQYFIMSPAILPNDGRSA